MTTAPRNPNGTFKSAFDVALERDEAEWHAKVKAKMDTGMSFDDAWVASGGIIVDDLGLAILGAGEGQVRSAGK